MVYDLCSVISVLCSLFCGLWSVICGLWPVMAEEQQVALLPVLQAGASTSQKGLKQPRAQVHSPGAVPSSVWPEVSFQEGDSEQEGLMLTGSEAAGRQGHRSPSPPRSALPGGSPEGSRSLLPTAERAGAGRPASSQCSG